MNELANMRTRKDLNFYSDILRKDYNENLLGTKKKSIRNRDLSGSQYEINTNLATKDPLKFMDSVLKFHGEI